MLLLQVAEYVRACPSLPHHSWCCHSVLLKGTTLLDPAAQELSSKIPLGGHGGQMRMQAVNQQAS